MDSMDDVAADLAETVTGILKDRKINQGEKVAAIVAEVRDLLDGIAVIELQGARVGHVTYESEDVVIQHDAAGDFVRLDVHAPLVVEFHPRQEK